MSHDVFYENESPAPVATHTHMYVYISSVDQVETLALLSLVRKLRQLSCLGSSVATASAHNTVASFPGLSFSRAYKL